MKIIFFKDIIFDIKIKTCARQKLPTTLIFRYTLTVFEYLIY